MFYLNWSYCGMKWFATQSYIFDDDVSMRRPEGYVYEQNKTLDRQIKQIQLNAMD